MLNTSYLNKREHSTVLVRFLTVLSLTVMAFFQGLFTRGDNCQRRLRLPTMLEWRALRASQYVLLLCL